MKNSKKSSVDIKIDPKEFDGLVSFEEIDSYELIKNVTKHGKQSVKIEKRNGKSKNEKKLEKKYHENINTGSNNTVKKNKPEQPVKRKREEDSEEPQDKKPKSDLINIESWKSIFVPDVILESIKELGFKEPSLIQKLSIPAAIKGCKDILGAAETGSGKTLAFMIPIIFGILKTKEDELLAKANAQDIESDDDDEELETEEISDEELETEEISDEELETEEISDEELETEEISDEELETEELNNEELKSEDEDVEDVEELEEDEEISDEEENMEEEIEEGSTCVKVIDNENFDFLDNNKRSVPSSENKLIALIITPTRELAIQVKKHTDAILTKTDIKTAVVIGGLSQEKQERVLNKRPEIVIGTPGRLWEMIQQENPHLSQLWSVKYLAIDETDRMLEKGHFEELQHILEKLNYFEESQKLRQNFIFSATLTLTHEAPKRLNKKSKGKISSNMKLENFIKMIGLQNKPKIIDITRKFGTAETLSETKVLCEKEEKDTYLYYFLKRFPGRTLIFCNSISCVKRLYNVLTTLKCKPQSLHASKQQKQRLESLEKFTSNNLSVLLATDVAARGIDIPGVKHIIHYEVPQTAEIYIHRSGRTARANQEGVSVLLIGSEDLKKYRQLCVTLNRSSELPSFPIETDTFENVRERVELAREIELMQHRATKKGRDEKWITKMQSEAGLDGDSNSDQDDDKACELALVKKKSNKELRLKQLKLSQLLSRPLISSSFSGRYPTSSGKLVIPHEHLMSNSEEGAIDLLKQKKPEIKLMPRKNKSKKEKEQRKRKFKKNKK